MRVNSWFTQEGDTYTLENALSKVYILGVNPTRYNRRTELSRFSNVILGESCLEENRGAIYVRVILHV